MELLMRGFVMMSLVIFSLGMLNSIYLSMRFTLGGYVWEDLEAEDQFC